MSDIVERLLTRERDEARAEMARLRADNARLREALASVIPVSQSLLDQTYGMTCKYEAEDVYLHGMPQLLQEAPCIIDAARTALAEGNDG